MKDHTTASLESARPQIDTRQAVDFCLQQLYRCRRHKITDEAATRLTYEELLGALLLARDDAETVMRLRQENSQLGDIEWENYRLKRQIAELRRLQENDEPVSFDELLQEFEHDELETVTA
ncbi:hypothetical protein [Roseiconus lacunae]|uniref:Uncharacterized protein n=1 Tax=Roseiconus lacunae TaxID=2605694 RepID=A0ABT7PEI4_9BACT|nr:hypothetical protein [Roseiconus lacunae]MDM4014886.1 hypothetical protein [Roseiconus lacunae]